MADCLHHYCPTCKTTTDLEEVRLATEIAYIEQVTEKYGIQYGSPPYVTGYSVLGYRCSNCKNYIVIAGKQIRTEDELLHALGICSYLPEVV